jgi:hypothetical protein
MVLLDPSTKRKRTITSKLKAALQTMTLLVPNPAEPTRRLYWYAPTSVSVVMSDGVQLRALPGNEDAPLIIEVGEDRITENPARQRDRQTEYLVFAFQRWTREYDPPVTDALMEDITAKLAEDIESALTVHWQLDSNAENLEPLDFEPGFVDPWVYVICRALVSYSYPTPEAP